MVTVGTHEDWWVSDGQIINQMTYENIGSAEKGSLLKSEEPVKKNAMILQKQITKINHSEDLITTHITLMLILLL